MTQQSTSSKRRSHMKIFARKPLASYSDTAYQILAQWLDTDKELLHEVLEAVRAGEAYETYQIPKASRNEWREINDPYGGLKEVQRRILDRLLYPIPVSNAAHGAVPGRSVVSNALQHLPDAQSLYCLDIRNAFPSVRFRRVHGIFRRHVRPLLRTYGPLPSAKNSGGIEPVDEAVHLLTALTTAKKTEHRNGKNQTVYCLPQGSPTSGYLLNLAALSLDQKIFKIISLHPDLRLRYTRYLDDITISSPVEIPEAVQKELQLAVIKNDFHIHHKKTQSLGSNDRHVICGVMLNEGKMQAEPELIERCKQLLEKAIQQSEPRKELQRRRKIRGVISFFKQVYGNTLPELIQQPYREYRKARNLPLDEAPVTPVLSSVPQRSEQEQDAFSLLAHWLDFSVEQVRTAAQMLDKQDAYETWSIDKKNGKKRHISSPKDILKDIQNRILSRLLYHIPTTVASHGFVPSRSIVTNALAHVEAKHLLNLDLQDAFPSVSAKRVEHVFQLGLGTLFKKFGLRCGKELRQDLVLLLAKLCTYNDELPQGAPTSGYLLNLACRTLDKRIFALLQEVGPKVTYTRYADDLTFTSEEAFDEKLLPRVKRTIQRSGFRWNPRKTHQAAVSKGQVIEICGLHVDGDQIRIPSKKIKQYRSVLRRAAIKIPTGQLDLDTKNHIQGIVGFVQMVYGELPRSLQKPYVDFLNQHPEARPTGAAREKFSFYPRLIV